MPTLFSPEEYKIWSEYYLSKYGWKTIPITGKQPLVKTNKLKWKNQGFSSAADDTTIETTILNEDNWLQQMQEVAFEYPQTLTGIALVCSANNVVGVDFDDPKFFQHWQRLYRIDCPVVKTIKGYHTYLKCDPPFVKQLLTDYYTIQGSGRMVLPPSIHYRKDLPSDRHWIGPNGNYNWIIETEVPVVNPYEIGLIPKEMAEQPDGISLDFMKVFVKFI